MAVALASSVSQTSPSNTTYIFTMTLDVGSDPNRFLLVHVLCPDQVAIGSVTFDGVALSAIGGNLSALFGLVAPHTGSHTITVTLGTSGSYYILMCATAWSGVDQTTPYLADIRVGSLSGTSAASASNTCPTNGALYGGLTTNQGSNSVAPSITAGTNIAANFNPSGWDMGSGYRLSSGVLSWNCASMTYGELDVLPINAVQSQVMRSLVISQAVNRSYTY